MPIENTPEEGNNAEDPAAQPPPPAAQPATPPQPGVITKADIEKNKTWALISYLTVIGLIIALVSDGKDSPYVKFHINQSLILVISGIITAVIAMIPILGWILAPILWLVILI